MSAALRSDIFQSQCIKTVCVVGGGMSGVVTAKALISRGFSVTLFEKQSKLGGLWLDNYYGVTCQSDKNFFEYPEKSFDEKVSRLATAQEIQDYVSEFAFEHSVLPSTRMEHNVEEISKEEDNFHWNVTFTTAEGHRETEAIDFVVLCTGFLGDAIIPKFMEEGRDAFKGSILHNSKWKDPKAFEGKTVVVVGNGKGASDAVVGALADAKGVHQVIRKKYWYIPLGLFGKIPIENVFLTRVSAAISPATYKPRTWLMKLMHGLLCPLLWLNFRLSELAMAYHYKFPWKLLPTSNIESDGTHPASQIPKDEYFEAVKSQKVQVHFSAAEKLEEDCVVLKDGERIKCDYIVAATGYNYKQHVLSEDILKALEEEHDGLWLYRHILHPNVPNLAFVGSNVETYANPCTQSLQAAWLARALSREMALPCREDMLADIKEVQELARRTLAPFQQTSIQVMATFIEYQDLLCKDMGFNPLAGGLWEVYMDPVLPRHYRHIVQ